MKATNEEIIIRRGRHEYQLRRSNCVANDRFEGLIDGKVLTEAECPAQALRTLILMVQFEAFAPSGSGG